MAELKMNFENMAEGFIKTAKENGMFVGRWIPVSKKLPDENGKYLVTQIAFGCRGVRIVCYGTKLSDVNNFEFSGKNYSGWYYYDSEYGHYEVDDIIAWMPLPEIYKGSEDKA